MRARPLPVEQDPRPSTDRSKVLGTCDLPDVTVAGSGSNRGDLQRGAPARRHVSIMIDRGSDVLRRARRCSRAQFLCLSGAKLQPSATPRDLQWRSTQGSHGRRPETSSSPKLAPAVGARRAGLVERPRIRADTRWCDDEHGPTVASGRDVGEEEGSGPQVGGVLLQLVHVCGDQVSRAIVQAERWFDRWHRSNRR